jgi:hypothetical protein
MEGHEKDSHAITNDCPQNVPASQPAEIRF